MEDEVWRQIPGIPNYEASSLGRTRRRETGRIHNRARLPRGYATLHCVINGKRTTTYVHRAIWTSFHGSIPTNMWINHIDGDKSNNRLENLEMVTPSENIRHAFRLGLNRARKGHRFNPETRARGERHGTRTHPEMIAKGENRLGAKLTEDAVRAMRKQRDAGAIYTDLAKAYGISRSTVQQIILRKRWKHVL